MIDNFAVFSICLLCTRLSRTCYYIFSLSATIFIKWNSLRDVAKLNCNMMREKLSIWVRVPTILSHVMYWKYSSIPLKYMPSSSCPPNFYLSRTLYILAISSVDLMWVTDTEHAWLFQLVHIDINHHLLQTQFNYRQEVFIL